MQKLCITWNADCKRRKSVQWNEKMEISFRNLIFKKCNEKHVSSEILITVENINVIINVKTLQILIWLWNVWIKHFQWTI